jgi:hypothetical protein
MMRAMRWLSLSLLVGVSAGCSTRSNIDAERLQGGWRVASVERNGAADHKNVGSTLYFNEKGVQFKLEWVFAKPLADALPAHG